MNKKQEVIVAEAWKHLTARPILHSLVRSISAENSVASGMTLVSFLMKLPVDCGSFSVPTSSGATALRAVLQSWLPTFEAGVATILPAFLPKLNTVNEPLLPSSPEAAQLTIADALPRDETGLTLNPDGSAAYEVPPVDADGNQVDAEPVRWTQDPAAETVRAKRAKQRNAEA